MIREERLHTLVQRFYTVYSDLLWFRSVPSGVLRITSRALVIPS